MSKANIESLAFFHISAHMPHSCDPNTILINSGSDLRKLKVSALKNIKVGDAITVSYLPFEEGMSTTTRQLHLMRLFGFKCQCDLCEAELASI